MPVVRSTSPLLIALLACQTSGAADDHAAVFESKILPILEDYCYTCHGDGEDKGKVSFDTFGSTAELMNQTKLWDHALRNVRAGLMPPPKKERLAADDLTTLVDWIKSGPLKLDPANPDPGRVTLRRLNRIEYRNTVRELTGYDFRTDEEFPADDTGYGFDNIGDVLTTSPMLLEKYMQAAETIVEKGLPLENRVTPRKNFPAGMFRGKGQRREEARLEVVEHAATGEFLHDCGQHVGCAGVVEEVRAGRVLHGLGQEALHPGSVQLRGHRPCRIVRVAGGHGQQMPHAHGLEVGARL